MHPARYDRLRLGKLPIGLRTGADRHEFGFRQARQTRPRRRPGRRDRGRRCRASSTPRLYFIGRIRTPWKERKDCPKNARADPRRSLHHRARPALGAGAEGRRELHPSGRALLDGPGRGAISSPGAGALGERRGTFALRSPARPNPIAMSVVKLLKVDGNGFRWSGSTASTARRCSTSSPISPRPTRSPMR